MWMFGFLLACGVTRFEKKIDQAEFDHWRALRVYMDEETQKSYRKLKTKEERDAFLKAEGLWDRFYQYEERIREQIVTGDVKVGWDENMLYLSWGQPYSRERIFQRPAQESYRLLYRFEQQPDGGVLIWEPGSKTQYKAIRLFQKEILIDDQQVAEIKEIDQGW